MKALEEKWMDALKFSKSEKENLRKCKSQLNDLIQAQEIVQEAAEEVQQQVHKHIAHIVNKCLQVIFPDPYEFKIRFVPKRGKTDAELVFTRDGKEIEKVGGGVIVIVAFALRLSSLLLSNKIIAPVMILDQPFSGDVSKDGGFLERVPEMLLLLTEEFGIQFIQVTHCEELKLGKIIKIK